MTVIIDVIELNKNEEANHTNQNLPSKIKHTEED